MNCYNTRQSVNLDLASVKQPPLNALFNFAQSTYGIFSVPTQETVNPPPVLDYSYRNLAKTGFLVTAVRIFFLNCAIVKVSP